MIDKKDLDLVMVLYKEMQYRAADKDPSIKGEEELKKKIKEASNVKKKMLKQSFFFLPFGLMLSIPMFMADEQGVIAAVMTSVAVIPFVFALYNTVSQCARLDSLGIFEPLKDLPVGLHSKQLSLLLSFDLIPLLSFALPAVIYLLIFHPLNGILAAAWVMTGFLIGHTVGFIVYSEFGFKLGSGDSSDLLKTVLKVVGLVVFMGLFFAWNFLQDLFIARADTILRYSVIYPLSAGAIFDPIQNFIILLVHLALIIPLYLYVVKRVWKRLLKKKEVSIRKKKTHYDVSSKSAVSSLLVKDFQILFRKTSSLVGFLIPALIVISQVFFSAQEDGLTLLETSGYLFMLAAFNLMAIESILSLDTISVDFLKTLPLKKRTYILSKILSLSMISITVSLGLVGLGTYFDPRTLIAIPYAFLLPVISSFIGLSYLFRYEDERIGIPDFSFTNDFLKFILLMILVVAAFGTIALPLLLLPVLYGIPVSYLIAGSMLLYLFFRSR